MVTTSPVKILAATLVLFGSLAGAANAQSFADWDETTDISPLGTLSVQGILSIGGSTTNVVFRANGTGDPLIHSIDDNSNQFSVPSIFTPAFARTSVVRANLGAADSVDILFDSPVRNPILYFNALGANTLTFSDPFTVGGADEVAIIDLVARSVTGINGSQLPPELTPNSGMSQEADFNLQFSGIFTSLSFVSSRTAGKLDRNAITVGAFTVPEPSSAILLGLAGPLFLSRRRRR